VIYIIRTRLEYDTNHLLGSINFEENPHKRGKKIVVLWDIMPCSLVNGYQHFKKSSNLENEAA
jgi:hypothetical protein